MGSSEHQHNKNKPLTILHIAPTPFFSDRGCHMRIAGIIRSLNSCGIKNLLCTYNLGRDIDGIETIRTAAIPGYTRLEAGPSAFKYLADILLFFKVCGQLRKRKPQIIHAYLHEGALIGWAARVLFFWRRIPMVFDVQGSLVGELEAHGYFDRYRFLKKIFWGIEYLITRMASRFICSSKNSLEILHREFSIGYEDLVLVNDGADEFDTSDLEQVRKALSLPEDKTIVIYTGALQEAKGVEDLCNTMLEAKKRGTNCHFLIIGYPERVVQDFCEQHQLHQMCTLAGRVPYEQLGNYLALADISIEPKLSESGEASGKLVNYMGAGLPVVCYDTAGNRQLLGEIGYFSNSPDPSGLMDQIEIIISNPEQAQERGGEAKTRVYEQFSWKAAGEKIQAIYASCL